ncbi:glycosyl hydrolase, family 31 [Cooperia oncophora]
MWLNLNFQLETDTSKELFHFVVKRKSTGTHLFDTSIGGLLFSDKFIQIVTQLPSDAMYGLGENVHQTLKHDFSTYLTWGMWARDEAPYSKGVDTKNLYGVHPFYMVVEPDGKAHGVFILNSNAQEFTTAPGPTIIYRAIGGVLDLYFFPGPTPEEVTQQYLSFIGTPVLPAYWALGFQLSRYGYKNLNDLKETIARNRKKGIPLETVVVDIDYMDRCKIFTIGKVCSEASNSLVINERKDIQCGVLFCLESPEPFSSEKCPLLKPSVVSYMCEFEGLPEYLNEVQSWGMRVVLIYDPAVQVNDGAFERALKKDHNEYVHFAASPEFEELQMRLRFTTIT